MTVYGSNNKAIVLKDNPLASGGEGRVYEIVSPEPLVDYCAKIYYKNSSERKQKILFMVNNKPAKIKDDIYKICWPTEILYDQKKEFIGFIMPMAFKGSKSLFNMCLPDLYRSLSVDWEKKFRWDTVEGMENRAKICVNISIAIYHMHATNKYTLVDYKPQNVLITHEGQVSIIDVDSIQIAENKKVLYNSHAYTPEYAPAEALNSNPSNTFISEYWDRFSIAVNFYELLVGIHPFTATAGGRYAKCSEIQHKIQNGLFVHGSKRAHITNIPPLHKYYDDLPESLKNLLQLAFEEGHVNPGKRPEIQELGKSIATAISNKQIKLNNYMPKLVQKPLHQEPVKKRPKLQQKPLPQEPVINLNSTYSAPPPPISPPRKKNYFPVIMVVIILILAIILFLYTRRY